MSCLHPYSASFVVRLFRSRSILSCLMFALLVEWHAEGQNVALDFPVFNGTYFSCSGIPSVISYAYCFYPNVTGDSVSILPPTYNNRYPNQAARFMYNAPVVFTDSGASIQASFSTFFIFSVSHVASKPNLGGGFAFMIAPEIDTPESSASGGFGMFPIDASSGRATSTSTMVIGVEFDTSFTENIDSVDVPHIGIDIHGLGSEEGNNASTVGNDFLDTYVGMWIDYNSSLTTLSVYSVPVKATDGSAASLKPAVPIVSMSGIVITAALNRRSYIGFGASVFGGGFEENLLHYWTFHTFGFPPESLLAQWFQWWAPLTTTKKAGLIAGAVVGTIASAWACSECLFFCFFKRIKNPQTPQEQRWPVRRRDSLPGVKKKKPPPRRKVRDSLSVANPLYLWEAPLESPEDPDSDDSRMAGIPEDEPSDNEDTPLMSPPDLEEGWQEPEVEPIEDDVALPEDEPIEDAVPVAAQSSKRVSRLGAMSSSAERKPAPARKAEPLPPPPAKEKVPLIVEERRPSPPRRKLVPAEVATQPSPPAAIQRKPSRVENKGPSPIEKVVAEPPTSAQRASIVQAAKPGSPSSQGQLQPPAQQRPTQSSQEPSRRVQRAKPTPPSPQQRPAQGALKPTSSPLSPSSPSSPSSPLPRTKEPGASQEGKKVTPQNLAQQPAKTSTSAPQSKASSAGKVSAAVPQNPQPKEQTSSPGPNKELPPGPRPSPQMSSPKGVPRPLPPKSPPGPKSPPPSKSPPPPKSQPPKT